jgi:hypothetical protein
LAVEEPNLTNQAYLEHLATDFQAAAVAQLPVTLVGAVEVVQVVQEWMHEATAIPIIQDLAVRVGMADLVVSVISLAQQ